MRYIFDHLKEIKRRYYQGQGLLLFVHFDGVLIPSIDDPAELVLEQKLIDLLKEIAGKKRISLAIVSGRQLDILKMRVNINNIYYVGNHGLEIESDIMKFTSPQAKKILPQIQSIKTRVSSAVENDNGIFLENKLLSFSVHCRSAEESNECIKNTERFLGQEVGNENEISLVKRGAELEVRPKVPLDSGDALNWILKNRACSDETLFPLVIADPFSDRHACRVANERDGISVVIGSDEPAADAKFYFENQREVGKLLEDITKW